MIYFDSGALLKFVKPEKESQALREWRVAQPTDSGLVTSQLAVLEIGRTLMRAGVDRQRVPYVVGQAVRSGRGGFLGRGAGVTAPVRTCQ